MLTQNIMNIQNEENLARFFKVNYQMLNLINFVAILKKLDQMSLATTFTSDSTIMLTKLLEGIKKWIHSDSDQLTTRNLANTYSGLFKVRHLFLGKSELKSHYFSLNNSIQDMLFSKADDMNEVELAEVLHGVVGSSNHPKPLEMKLVSMIHNKISLFSPTFIIRILDHLEKRANIHRSTIEAIFERIENPEFNLNDLTPREFQVLIIHVSKFDPSGTNTKFLNEKLLNFFPKIIEDARPVDFSKIAFGILYQQGSPFFETYFKLLIKELKKPKRSDLQSDNAVIFNLLFANKAVINDKGSHWKTLIDFMIKLEYVPSKDIKTFFKCLFSMKDSYKTRPQSLEYLKNQLKLVKENEKNSLGAKEFSRLLHSYLHAKKLKYNYILDREAIGDMLKLFCFDVTVKDNKEKFNDYIYILYACNELDQGLYKDQAGMYDPILVRIWFKAYYKYVTDAFKGDKDFESIKKQTDFLTLLLPKIQAIEENKVLDLVFYLKFLEVASQTLRQYSVEDLLEGYIENEEDEDGEGEPTAKHNDEVVSEEKEEPEVDKDVRLMTPINVSSLEDDSDLVLSIKPLHTRANIPFYVLLQYFIQNHKKLLIGKANIMELSKYAPVRDPSEFTSRLIDRLKQVENKLPEGTRKIISRKLFSKSISSLDLNSTL